MNALAVDLSGAAIGLVEISDGGRAISPSNQGGRWTGNVAVSTSSSVKVDFA